MSSPVAIELALNVYRMGAHDFRNEVQPAKISAIFHMMICVQNHPQVLVLARVFMNFWANGTPI